MPAVYIYLDFIRNWEELAPYLRLPAREYEIKKDGRYGDQKREALRMWKEQNGSKATYRALIVIAKQVSNVELAENIEALVARQPALTDDSPSPVADLEKIHCFGGSAKAREAHVPGDLCTSIMNVCLSLVCPAAELLKHEELMAYS